MGNTTNEKAVYQTIALDIANKIVRGEFKQNERLRGRSLLASMYNVSPETIRRAVSLLKDGGIVEVSKGSGIQIVSISAAEKFIDKYKTNEYISTMRDDILELIEEKKQIDDEIDFKFKKILDFMDRFKNISPFTLIEVEITDKCIAIGKRVNELKFWQKTGATILAFRRKDEITVSPGPDYIFTSGDVIVVIGDKNVYEKTYQFLYKE